MNTETLASALGGRRSGSHWMAPCPTHEGRAPSLSTRDADDGTALVIGELRSRGLWDEARESHRPPTRKHLPQNLSIVPAQDCAGRTSTALRLWHSAVPAQRTHAET